ncbi:hypothetical protein [Consotaella salsifontis]|uniref:Uncharacterized protein n=1 Tax=Consotaella salsifontis TaxID=1365950 RepID=A0A1T4SMW9_9HYPH|nr:hypothetical protein [Consotaella salsifontis]SKA29537.1 hypothetical protein SAMN05428963_11237 [Consotaella salsifontis]
MSCPARRAALLLRLPRPLFLVLASLTLCSPAFAGAWTLEKGKAQIIVTATHTKADRVFDADRAKKPAEHFSKTGIDALAEYGLVDGVTVMLKGEAESLTIDHWYGEQTPKSGLADIGARVRLWQGGSSVVAVEGHLRTSGVGEDIEAIGKDGMAGEVRLLWGRSISLWERPAFAGAEIAYRVEEGAAPDVAKLDLAAGIRPWRDVLLMAQSFSTLAAEGEPQDQHKLELSVVYDFTEAVSLQLGGIATVAGSNAPAEKGLVAGLWLRF